MSNDLLNFATTSKGKLVFTKFKDVEFTTQSFNLPGFKITTPTIDNARARITLPPTRVEYEPLVVQIIITSGLGNFKTLLDWMQNSTTDTVQNFTSDATFMTTDGSEVSATFESIHPTSVGAITFTTTAPSVQYLTTQVTFNYVKYKFN